MKPYLISYDLDQPGQAYKKLESLLIAWHAVRVLYSVWLLRSNSGAKEIRDAIWQVVDSNDRILVVALTGEAAWRNLMISDDATKNALNG